MLSPINKFPAFDCSLALSLSLSRSLSLSLSLCCLWHFWSFHSHSSPLVVRPIFVLVWFSFYLASRSFCFDRQFLIRLFPSCGVSRLCPRPHTFQYVHHPPLGTLIAQSLLSYRLCRRYPTFHIFHSQHFNQGPHTALDQSNHQFSWLFHNFLRPSFAFFMTYFYATFKHAAKILEGKGSEWLPILGPIIKGVRGRTPRKIKFWKHTWYLVHYFELLHKNIINLVKSVFIWRKCTTLWNHTAHNLLYSMTDIVFHAISMTEFEFRLSITAQDAWGHFLPLPSPILGLLSHLSVPGWPPIS